MNEAVTIQANVIWALLLREIRTRFGQNQLGYLWALLGPLASIVLLMLIFQALGRLAPAGLDFPLFLMTGIVPWFLFNGTLRRALKAIDGNRGLLVYPRVKPLDLIIARSTLEAATYLVVFVLLLLGLAAIRGPGVVPEQPLVALAAFAGVALLGAGIGAAMAALLPVLPSVEHLLGVVTRPLYFISGIFFSIEVVPEPFRSYLLLNPLLHANEMMRAAFFVSYEGRFASPGYLLAWVVGAVFTGLVMQRALRRCVAVTA